MPVMTCANPAWGTHLVVRGDQREETLVSILQQVLAWAEDDAPYIEYHQGGRVGFVRIPPEVIANDHGELVLRKGGKPIPLALDHG